MKKKLGKRKIIDFETSSRYICNLLEATMDITDARIEMIQIDDRKEYFLFYKWYYEGEEILCRYHIRFYEYLDLLKASYEAKGYDVLKISPIVSKNDINYQVNYDNGELKRIRKK